MHATVAERLLTLVWLTPFVIAWLSGALIRLTVLNNEQRRVNREQRAFAGGGGGAQPDRARAARRHRPQRQRHDRPGLGGAAPAHRRAGRRSGEALETVEAVGREALAEMRRMVGVLRAGRRGGRARAAARAGPARPARRRSSAPPGLPVELQVTGPAQPLPPGLDLTAYRLVQEGLTNTLRHARTRAAPRCQSTTAGRSSGSPSATTGRPARPRRRPRPGNGLLGMRERVAVYGGALVARAAPEGGFELSRPCPWTRRDVPRELDADPRAHRRRPGAGARRLPDDPRDRAGPRRSSARPATATRRSQLARELRPDVVLMDVRMPGHRRDRGHPAARWPTAGAGPGWSC